MGKILGHYKQEHENSYQAFGLSDSRGKEIDKMLGEAFTSVINKYHNMVDNDKEAFEAAASKGIDIYAEAGQILDEEMDWTPNEIKYISFQIGNYNDTICGEIMSYYASKRANRHPANDFINFIHAMSGGNAHITIIGHGREHSA